MGRAANLASSHPLRFPRVGEAGWSVILVLFFAMLWTLAFDWVLHVLFVAALSIHWTLGELAEQRGAGRPRERLWFFAVHLVFAGAILGTLAWVGTVVSAAVA